MKSLFFTWIASFLFSLGAIPLVADDDHTDGRGSTPGDKFNRSTTPGYINVGNDPTGYNRNVIRHYVYQVPNVVPGSTDKATVHSPAPKAPTTSAPATKISSKPASPR